MKKVLLFGALGALLMQNLLGVETLHVSSPTALVDCPISLSVKGVDRKNQAHITASMQDDDGEMWMASGFFQADARGEIHLDRQAPLQGTYRSVDGMGLFWSMEAVSGKAKDFKCRAVRLAVEISVFVDGKQVARQTIYRLRKAEEVARRDVRENGLVGTLFLPLSDKPLPVVVTLSGSNGGLSENRAQLLASHGFAVLALGYFGAEGLPANLENIPLEYFGTAFNWLKTQSAVDAQRVALYGASRGAELALILGTVYPERIQAIVAALPSSVVLGALGEKELPAWLYRGTPYLPGAPVPKTDTSNGAGQNANRAIATTSYFMKGMHAHPEAYRAAAIPVEKIECPLLLIAGGDDQMWPSALFAEQIAQRMRDKNSSVICERLHYPGAGHSINVPFLPACKAVYYHPVGNLWFSMGGTPQEDDLASRDSWHKLIAFLQNSLNLNISL